MIALKTERELEVVAENARLLREILLDLAARVEPGITTGELDRLAERWIRAAGAAPAFKGYQGYPATLCCSVNAEVVHGIPSFRRVLREGDVVSLDLGLRRGGYYADAAVTVGVGQVGPEAQALVRATLAALRAALEAAKIGAHVSDLSYAIESTARRFGFYPVKEFVGHGIGRALHEDPQIPNFGPPGFGPVLREGMVLCPEPMLKGDDLPVRILPDGWTAVTGSGALAAHFEEMVALTPEGPWVLTGWVGEEIWAKRS
ncbi:MAG: type I methionyl aminopeptidase [Candidatus Bipolaricaulota bacterium]|nr:type I methionyl aminopeptidase [Candidatus Bipolaricaulota bacterium]